MKRQSKNITLIVNYHQIKQPDVLSKNVDLILEGQ